MVAAYFLDSSALLKRYVPETGTSWIQSLTRVLTLMEFPHFWFMQLLCLWEGKVYVT